MCCCGKPTINGEPKAYSWDGKSFMTYEPNPPDLRDDDELVRDLPGRCGGVDSHSHHVRLVKCRGRYALLVRHGAGDERVELGYEYRKGITLMAALNDGDCYWHLLMIHQTVREAATHARNAEKGKWAMAAANKRIKTRKYRGGSVKVWIVPEATVPNTNNYSLT